MRSVVLWIMAALGGLDADSFSERERAQVRLVRAGYLALPVALAGQYHPSAEVRHRSQALAHGLGKEAADYLEAVWLLLSPRFPSEEYIGSMEAHWRVCFLARATGLARSAEWLTMEVWWMPPAPGRPRTYQDAHGTLWIMRSRIGDLLETHLGTRLWYPHRYGWPP